MAKQKRVPKGKALRWSEEDLDRLSEITPGDIERAREHWRANVPPMYRNLLDAEMVEPDADAE